MVDLHNDSGREGFYPYSVLIDLGATYNFISLSVADELGLEVIKAGKSKIKKKAPLPITTVNSEPLHTIAVIQQMVQIRDSVRLKRSYVINFVIADIAHYN
jgi:hypothetical protein